MKHFRNFNELLETCPNFAETVGLVAAQKNRLEELLTWKQRIDNLAKTLNDEDVRNDELIKKLLEELVKEYEIAIDY